MKYELRESFCSAVQQSACRLHNSTEITYSGKQNCNNVTIIQEGANSELHLCQNAVNLVTQTQTLTLTNLYHHQLY